MALHQHTRRDVIAASLSAAAVVAAGSAAAQTGRTSPTLVAYFSRSGTARVIAGQISRSLRADLFEIEPAKPYPADYFETVEQARQERDNGFEPTLKAVVPDLATYSSVFLCFPIWGETAPPVIRSFLSAHDLKGKTLTPAIVHGGFGLGNSLSVLRSHAPQARLVEGLSMQGPQERQTVTRVNAWLEQAKAER